MLVHIQSLYKYVIENYFTILLPIFSSTMSGRRLRDSVKKVLIANGFPSDVTVVIAGLSNTYSDYVTTFEEYQVICQSLC